MSGGVWKRLARLSAATVSTQLLKRGLRSVAIPGLVPVDPRQRPFAGPASTLRFLPLREDLADPSRPGDPASSQRRTIEEAQAGSVIVVETGGRRSAGILGDILATRLKARGVAGLVTDGAVRDFGGVAASGLAVLCAGAAPPPAVAAFSDGGRDLPIACGGVTVRPGDGVIADRDGAVVVPRDLVEEVVDAAEEQEAFEAWALGEVASGQPLAGLYPPDARTMARYRRSRDP